MGRAERCENMIADILFERLAADAFDDVAAESHTVVRVAGNDAGRKETIGLIVDQELAERNLVFRIGEKKFADDFFETRRVGHQVAEGDGFVESGTNLEIEIGVHVNVEVQLVLLDELHDGDPGEKFGDGCETKGGNFGIDRRSVVDIDVAVAFAEKSLTVLHDQDGGASDVVAFELQRDDAIEESFEVR